MAIVADKARQQAVIDKPRVKRSTNVSRNVFAITPSDDPADNFGTIPRGIVAAGAGNAAVVELDDTVTVVALAAGQILPIMCKRVNSSLTTATGLVGVI